MLALVRSALLAAPALALGACSAEAPDAKGPLDFEVRHELHRGAVGSYKVVLLADRYLVEERTRFLDDCRRVLEAFRAEPAFDYFADYLTITAVFLPGADDDPLLAELDEGTMRTLETHDPYPASRALTVVDPSSVSRMLSAAGLENLVDSVLVLVNDSKRLGAQESGFWRNPFLVAVATNADVDTAIHELGHAIASLEDEYEYSSEDVRKFGHPPVPRRPLERNLFLEDAAHPFEVANTEWAHFAELEGTDGMRWKFRVGDEWARDIYRPWPRCRMRNSANVFCPVCSEELARVIMQRGGFVWDDEAFHRALPVGAWMRLTSHRASPVAMLEPNLPDSLGAIPSNVISSSSSKQAMLEFGSERFDWDLELLEACKDLSRSRVWSYLVEDFRLGGLRDDMLYSE